MSVSSTIVYPQDRAEAGKHYWSVLFNVAAQYPDHPTRDDKVDTNNFIKSTIKRFTCHECIDNAFDYIRKHPIESDNRESLMKWLCGLKNNANEHEGKETINCDQFILNSLNAEAGCKTCTLTPIKAPSVNLNPPKPANTVVPTPAVVTQTPKRTYELDPEFESVWNWDKRYPSLKKSLNIENREESVKIGGSGAEESTEEFSERYPSLQGFGFGERKQSQEEELDGVIKPLDSMYAIPAQIAGIKPHEMNLAYTPEMLTNTVSLITQVYFTSFGSLFTTVLSSLGLLGVSLFAKNNLSHYDRLFLQNTTASMLFHSLNFINPRLSQEVIPAAQQFVEGLMTMNFDKIKEAFLFGHKSEESEKAKSAQELLEMLETGGVVNGKVDMDRLAKMGPHAFSARDIQNASQPSGTLGGIASGGFAPDLRTTGGYGFKGTAGALTKDDIERMFNEKARYNVSNNHTNPNYGVLGAVEDKYGYILNNEII